MAIDFSKIKMLVLDMDGVLTDSGIYLFNDGKQARRFHAKDGEGIKQLVNKGVKVAILTGSREEGIVSKRSKMMHISPDLVSIDTKDKLEVLQAWSKQEGVSLDEMAYIGDDTPDIPVLQAVGLSACPNDAIPQVKAVVDIVLERDGGQACVREFLEHLL